MTNTKRKVTNTKRKPALHTGKTRSNPILPKAKDRLPQIKTRGNGGYVFKGDDNVWYSLTTPMKNFADLYIYHSNKGTASPGKTAYKEAYPKQALTSKDITLAIGGSALLRHPNVAAYIRKRLDNEIMTPEQVDVELSRVIKQYSDLSSKVGAIKEYNKIRNRVKGSIEVGINKDAKEALERLGKLLG